MTDTVNRQQLEEERREAALKAAEGDENALKRYKELSEEVNAAREQEEMERLAGEERRRIAEQERRRAEEERLESARTRYRELAERRAEVEEQAQEALGALTATLEEIGEIDLEQRGAMREAGINTSFVDAGLMLNNWLSAHLRPYMPDTVLVSGFNRPLTELTPLPPPAYLSGPSPEEVEEREREAAQTRKAREAVEIWQEVLRACYEVLIDDYGTGQLDSPNPETRYRHVEAGRQRLVSRFPGISEDYIMAAVKETLDSHGYPGLVVVAEPGEDDVEEEWAGVADLAEPQNQERGDEDDDIL